MQVERDYHLGVKRSLAAFLLPLVLLLVPVMTAQINGVPASVTSIGFGGNFNRVPGVPASITSVGPFGLVPSNRFVPPTSFVGPNNLIIPNNLVSNPFLRVRPNPPLFRHRPRHDHNGFFGGVPVVAVPYAVPVAVPVEDYGEDSSEVPESEYQGGPTIFDRRGPGSRQPNMPSTPEQPAASAPAAAQPEPVAEQPTTVLVFNDGHELEIQNYAIVGDTLFDMTPGHRRRVLLSELNLPATSQKNEDRGVGFVVPGAK